MTYTEMEWSGLKEIDLTHATGVQGTKTKVQVTMPDGVITIQDFALSYDRSSVADLLRRAAVAVDRESRLRPIDTALLRENLGGKG